MIERETIVDGRYRVLSRVGSGGMADVYLAEDLLLGRQLAVKVLHHHFAEDQEFVERFRREASSAAGLSHPNIVGIFDRGEWDGTYYIAMEYVPGRSLKTVVRERGALEAPTAIDIATQILQAARFAHARAVIHRDLKPHNVILDEEGRARVTDFGIAHAGASDMTLTGSIMGTAQYLSPEQAQGHAVSARSDLYAVGVILYELLTGAVPFDGDSAVAIAFKQVSAQPPAPSSVNRAIPPYLDAIVLRALAKDPAARYANADEFIAALQAARARLPAGAASAVMTRQMAVAPDAAPPEGRPQQGGASVLVPAGTALSTGVPPAALLMPADGSPPGAMSADGADEQLARRRRQQRAIAGGILAALAVLAIALLLLPSSSANVTVPGVAGETEATALAAVRGAGLTPFLQFASSLTVPSGHVVSQEPLAGRMVHKGARVTIVVSTGPGSTAVPNVARLTAAQATAKLKAAGFKPTSETLASSSVPAGLVISTSPPAETVVRAGAAVTVVVSSGPAQVSVPDVVGQSRAAAEASLANAGLVVGAVGEEASSGQSPGNVLAQSPGAGSQLPDGARVNLTLATAPAAPPAAPPKPHPHELATVPNVFGQREQQAVAALKAAGFSVKTSFQTTKEAAQVGVVLKQTPVGGHQARKGASVTIVIGATPPPPTTTTPTTTTAPPAATPTPAP